MKGDHMVLVLDAGRLKSELAVYVWAQSESWRRSQSDLGETPRLHPGFIQSKASLIEEVGKFAGKKIPQAELLGHLVDIIGKGKHQEFYALEPQMLASRISTKV